jgi:hypothetical protein
MPAFWASAWKNSRASSVSKVPIFGALKDDVPDEEGAAGKINGGFRHCLVHGEIDRGITCDATAIAEGLRYGLADGDAGVFDRMVIIDMQVALGLDLHVDQGMSRQLVEHMVEEADAGRNRRLCRYRRD